MIDRSIVQRVLSLGDIIDFVLFYVCVCVSWFSVANRSHHLLFSLLFMIDWISFFLLSLLSPRALSLALSRWGLVRLRSRSSAVFSLRFNNKAKEDQKSFNKEGEKISFLLSWLNIMSCDWERDSISSIFSEHSACARHKSKEWHMHVDVCICFLFLFFSLFASLVFSVSAFFLLPFIIVVIRLFVSNKVKIDEVNATNICKDCRLVRASKVHRLWK